MGLKASKLLSLTKFWGCTESLFTMWVTLPDGCLHFGFLRGFPDHHMSATTIEALGLRIVAPTVVPLRGWCREVAHPPGNSEGLSGVDHC